jgi:Pyruvate/2-oxoacid:ferredoxin oxidoreductase delta subunit
MKGRAAQPLVDHEKCAVCGPCRYAARGIVPGRSCANGQDCERCAFNQEIAKRCLALHPRFFERPLQEQVVAVKKHCSDLVLRHTCNACELICPELAITPDPLTGRRVIDPAYCKSCGLCAHFCPEKAIRIVPAK